jgi:5-methylcytosine-specific restriction endonuclease McrA
LHSDNHNIVWLGNRSRGVITKRCQSCHQDKPEHQFYRHRQHADGLTKTCIACLSVKACTRCHVTKPLDALGIRRIAADGHQSRCKACQQQRQKAFRVAHPEYVRQRDARYRQVYAEKIRARRARWGRAHPGKSQQYAARRRARKRRAGKIEPIDRDYVYKRDRGICSICGRKVRKKDMSMDHIIALAQGGEHSLTNVTLVHLQCNTRKRTRVVPQQLYLIG